MKGCYSRFPDEVHGTVRYRQPKANAGRKKVQQAILSALFNLNQQNFTLPNIATSSRGDCMVQFEIGVADDTVFSFLDRDDAKQLQVQIRKQLFDYLDFFCAVKYYLVSRKKPTPLKFDYFMFRFVFTKKLMTLSLFHERGPRRVSTEELIMFLTERINMEMEGNRLQMQGRAVV